MKLTSPKGLLVQAPQSEIELERRGRAELIQAVCLVRFVALLLLTIILSWRGMDGMRMIQGVTAVGFVAYLISRTRFYAWAVVIVIMDPIIGVPNFVASNSYSLFVLISAPIWLSIGPFISSLVFRPAITAVFMTLTVVSFTALAYGVDPVYRAAVASQFLAIGCTGALALIGNVIRVRNARILREERGKVLQSAKLASLGEMAAGVAHELNSPLGAVMLNLEVLRERLRMGAIDVRAMELRIDSAIQVVERMGQIITGLRAFARDANEEAFTEIPVRALVDDTLNMCRERFQHHGIDLRIDPASLAQVTRVQRVQVAQALLNLLNNAFDAVAERSDRWVEVRGRITDRAVELVVVDAGPGIAPEMADKIFQPFFTTKDYGAGTGLGLSVSRGIALKQGGDLAYEPAERTTFVMRLPRAS